jgi:hypothetical protein
MTNTKRVIQPFFQGYLNKSIVEENVLDGALFSITPRSGQVSYLLSRNFFFDEERHIEQ